MKGGFALLPKPGSQAISGAHTKKMLLDLVVELSFKGLSEGMVEPPSRSQFQLREPLAASLHRLLLSRLVNQLEVRSFGASAHGQNSTKLFGGQVRLTSEVNQQLPLQPYPGHSLNVKPPDFELGIQTALDWISNMFAAPCGSPINSYKLAYTGLIVIYRLVD